jgi:hypothetical protein
MLKAGAGQLDCEMIPPPMEGHMVSQLPIPPQQLFYAEASFNPQAKPIEPLIDYIHYPTLGCPALLGPEARLQVLLSLPAQIEAKSVTFHLIDRHRQPSASFQVSRQEDPESISDLPNGERRLFRYWLGVEGVPFALFDLQATWGGGGEVQFNAVRRYQVITGQEQVIFCGDAQYNVDNRICLQRFIECVNRLDVAWIALIGDICDNGVKSPANLLRLAATAHSGPVTHYYRQEYGQSHELLRQLHHPVFVVPGNHDGMSANDSYQEGNPSEVVTGPDPMNKVAYDGLHHFRRTFGPLYFRLDWAGTRYLFTNSFELTRQQRLGYHAIVANWGGWMNQDQMDWFKLELETAPGKRQVILSHHDPRGGSMSNRLGYYYRFRPYEFDQRWPILKAYLAYLLGHGRTMWQQEWMAPVKGALADHPVQHILRGLLDHQVWAVIMGHDNENWVDSYSEGDDLFKTKPTTHTYVFPEEADSELMDAILAKLKQADYAGVATLLEAHDKKKGHTALSAALGEMERAEGPGKVMFAADPAKEWNLQVKSAIHFIHVDDVGGHNYDDESDFGDYGFVVAQLEGGAPVKVQSHRLSGGKGKEYILETD